jgi:hypothetical protein
MLRVGVGQVCFITVFVVLATATAVLANTQKCSITPRFDSLYSLTSQILLDHGDIRDPQLQRLASFPNRRAISRRLTELGAEHLEFSVTDYLNALTEAESVSWLIRDRAFRLALAELHVFVSAECPERGNPFSIIASLEGLTGISFTNGGTDSQSNAAETRLRVYVFVSFVVSVIAILFGIAILMRTVQRGVVARLHQRKTCRVAALFRLGARGGIQ